MATPCSSSNDAPAAAHTAYLALGSNLGDREATLRQALRLIENRIGPIQAQSDFFVTQPSGFQSENTFLNAAIAVRTTLQPAGLLLATQQIERRLGRTSKSVGGVYHDRTIDIDILFYDDLVLRSPSLQIPHPRLAARPFVLQPLAQIAPGLVHPLTGQTIAQHLQVLSL